MTTPTPSSPSRSRPNNKPILSGAGKEGFIHSLFDRISGRYDLFNRLSSLGLDQRWRKKAIADLRLVPGMQILDCASGTGDLARLAAEQIVPLGLVVACDLSGPMLRFAQGKLNRWPPAPWHIRMAQGRAEALPFGPDSFDAATMGFALRNVADLQAAFREFYRLLRPGGRLALLEFGRPKNPILRIGHSLWLAAAVPVIGLLTTGTIWPFLYLRRSIAGFMDPSEVAYHLQGVGFADVEAEPLDGGIVILYRASRQNN